MINYSIYDEEVIYDGWDDFEPEYEILEYKGLKLQVEKISEKQVKINQVISSDPQDFLNENIAPGNTLNLNLQLE